MRRWSALVAIAAVAAACASGEATSAPAPAPGAAPSPPSAPAPSPSSPPGEAAPGQAAPADAAPVTHAAALAPSPPAPAAPSPPEPAAPSPPEPAAPSPAPPPEEDDPGPDPPPAKGVTKGEVQGGTHWRYRVPGRGVVHVWRPRGYKRSGGIVVYLHGHNSSADDAWRNYKLAEQFRASRQNALFIVPDANRSNDDALPFPSLNELLKSVWRSTKLDRPGGPIVVIGHSGSFRTIVPWLENRAIAHVILLDALYAGQDKFAAWVGRGGRKMTIVGGDTAGNAEVFLRRFKQAVRMKRIPDRWEEFTKAQRTATLLYIRAQYSHMALVTSGKVIPLILRRTPLKPIAGGYGPKQ